MRANETITSTETPQDSNRSAPLKNSRSALSPGKVFVALIGLVLVVVGVGFWLSLGQSKAVVGDVSGQPTSNNFRLTNSQAIARLNKLVSLRDDAYRHRDLSLLASIYATKSSVSAIARKEIRGLLRKHVIDRSTSKSLSVKVLANSNNRIHLRQIVDISPRFVSEEGQNVTTGPTRLTETILWVLADESGRWLIENGTIEKADRRD